MTPLSQPNTPQTTVKKDIPTSVEKTLQASKAAFLKMSVLTTDQKNQALESFARLIEAGKNELLAANQKDLAQAEADRLDSNLYGRLKLDTSKITQLVKGIRDLIKLPDPAGQILSKTLLDNDLVLEKQTVPLGVIGIIFESRPDVMPQVLSLILKSGNAVVLKGGREAKHSNEAMQALVDQLTAQCGFLPDGWASLLEGREAVHEMLTYPQYVDLVIPRGSNQLVQSIMASTKIPVLGHADGVCHIYVHHSAKQDEALAIVIDSKSQYPSACNALETLLVDAQIADSFLKQLEVLCQASGITLKGCKNTKVILPDIEDAQDNDWSTEYGCLTLSVKVVETVDQAVEHINRYGSHHTDAILASQTAVIEQFLRQVDSACAFANASTRFADGFRFGFGAEIGISTAKTHARGPVGLEGLVIYKYKLSGSGHIVKTYTGDQAKPFLHQPC